MDTKYLETGTLLQMMNDAKKEQLKASGTHTAGYKGSASKEWSTVSIGPTVGSGTIPFPPILPAPSPTMPTPMDPKADKFQGRDTNYLPVLERIATALEAIVERFC